MRIAIVGMGYWGSRLVRNLVAVIGSENVIAVDTDPCRLEDACRQYPSITRRDSLESALAEPDVRAVIIATPVKTHTTLAATALRAGCHVLVEKPLTTSIEEAELLIDLAERQDLVLMVGHTFLFSPRVQWVKNFVARRELGELHYITSSRLNLGTHRPDANVIWDLAPHDFSIIFHILDDVPTTIATSARSVLRKEMPDVAFMNLTFASGVVASVAVSWFAPRKIRTLMLVGDHHMVVYDDTDPEEPVKVHDRGVVIPDSTDFGVNQLTYRYGDTVAPHISPEEPLSIQLTHFVECIQHGYAPRSDGRFGLDVVAALEAADASWRTGGAPVAVKRSQLIGLAR